MDTFIVGTQNTLDGIYSKNYFFDTFFNATLVFGREKTTTRNGRPGTETYYEEKLWNDDKINCPR